MAVAANIADHEHFQPKKQKVLLKVGMLGDICIGKTSLKVRYKLDKYDSDYSDTLGVDVMDKDIELKNAIITISMFDLGGAKEFAPLMPIVCEGAQAILFMFDLTRQATLFNVKRWYVEAKKESKTFLPFLVGTKFDLYERMADSYKNETDSIAKKYSKKMHNASIIYCSSQDNYNVNKVFQKVIEQVLDIKLDKKKKKNKNKNKDRNDKKKKKKKKHDSKKKNSKKDKNKENNNNDDTDDDDDNDDNEDNDDNDDNDSKEDFDDDDDVETKQ